MAWKWPSSRALASQKLNSGFDPCIGKHKRGTTKEFDVPRAKQEHTHAEDKSTHRHTSQQKMLKELLDFVVDVPSSTIE